MNTVPTHESPAALEMRYHAQPLFRYVYEPEMPDVASPRPYFHPLRTLAGKEVTNIRPDDHPWHMGPSMTAPLLR